MFKLPLERKPWDKAKTGEGAVRAKISFAYRMELPNPEATRMCYVFTGEHEL